MYACVVNKQYDSAFVLYNGETLAEMLALYPNEIKVLCVGMWEDCQICADSYNED